MNKKSWLLWLPLFPVLLLFCLSLSSCTKKGKPPEIKAGEHKCSYCMMGIADMRFRSASISSKRKVHYFDSIECLTAAAQKNPKSVHSAWVGDFFNKGQWINLSKAHILQSPKLNSPMGAGLSAYKSEEDLKRAQKIYTGRPLSKKQLDKHVVKWRKKLQESSGSM